MPRKKLTLSERVAALEGTVRKMENERMEVFTGITSQLGELKQRVWDHERHHEKAAPRKRVSVLARVAYKQLQANPISFCLVVVAAMYIGGRVIGIVNF